MCACAKDRALRNAACARDCGLASHDRGCGVMIQATVEIHGGQGMV
jgi:hypothetical protein